MTQSNFSSVKDSHISICKQWSYQLHFEKLKTMVGAALVKDLDVKFANILYLLEILHHVLQNADIRLDQKI